MKHKSEAPSKEKHKKEEVETVESAEEVTNAAPETEAQAEASTKKSDRMPGDDGWDPGQEAHDANKKAS